MSKSLIIVESPSKAKTLKKYLGKNFNVMASVGHIKDLPKSKFGVDLDKNFEPRYVIIRGKKKILDEIKKAAKAADKVYLGPDPDREGEAIAWHIAEELNGKQDKIYRVLFHEITEKGVKKALAQPGKIDQKKVRLMPRFEEFEAFLAREAGRYFITPCFKRCVYRLKDIGIIIDDHNFCF